MALMVILPFSSYSQYTYNKFVTSSTVLNVETSCANVGFESTDFSDWYAYYGTNIDGITGTYDGITTISNTSGLPTAIGGSNPYGIANSLLFEHIGPSPSYTDPYISDMTFEGNYSLRLGAVSTTSPKSGIKQRIKVNSSNAIFELNYAVVMMHHASHDYNGQPYFRFYLEDKNYNRIDCSEILEVAGSMTGAINAGPIQGQNYSNDPVYYKDWTSHTINLLDFVDINDEVTIVFEVATCQGNGHFTYAYIDGKCSAGVVTPPSTSTRCLETTSTFSHPLTSTLLPGEYRWNFYNNAEGTGLPVISSDAEPTYTYLLEGDYLVTLSVKNDYNSCYSVVHKEVVTVTQCCSNCTSISLKGGKRYWVSAWVHEDHPNQQKTYEQANLQFNFLGGSETSVQFYTSGAIIDGWQRIIGEFTLLGDINQMTVVLNAHSSHDTYFDDIRIHPFNGSMKSYVYDGQTFWLTSELDDNNYATFYEYDEEGGLVRIKKETARGIVTIQETRSNTIKKENE